MKFDPTEQLGKLFSTVGIGDFSLQKYLLVIGIGIIVLTAIPWTVALLRGAGRPVAAASVRDVLIGILCAMGIITVPLSVFFIGRGYLTALIANNK